MIKSDTFDPRKLYLTSRHCRYCGNYGQFSTRLLLLDSGSTFVASVIQRYDSHMFPRSFSPCDGCLFFPGASSCR